MGTTTKEPDYGHQAVIDFFCDEWAARHDGEKYPFNRGKDAQTIQALRKMARSDDDLRTLMLAYLNLDEAWIVDHGHSLAILRVSLPQVMQAVRRSRQPAAVAKRLRGVAAWAGGEK